MRTFEYAQSAVLGPGPLSSGDRGLPARTGGLSPLTAHHASVPRRNSRTRPAGKDPTTPQLSSGWPLILSVTNPSHVWDLPNQSPILRVLADPVLPSLPSVPELAAFLRKPNGKGGALAAKEGPAPCYTPCVSGASAPLPMGMPPFPPRACHGAISCPGTQRAADTGGGRIVITPLRDAQH